MWEIELKVRVPHPDQIAHQLDGRAVREGDYRREDIYYCPAEDPGGPTAFRLRSDRDSWVVTHKVKTVGPQGIEESRETEFGVSDPQAFDRFAQALGYVAAVRKTKVGSWWRLGPDFKAELSEVPPLGYWLELEILLGFSASDDDIDKAKIRLTGFLRELGLDPNQAETRPYTQMIREALATEKVSG